MSKLIDLKYFKGWTLENFPFIEEDFDVITTYQFMSKIVEYINKVIYNQKIVDENNNQVMEEITQIRDYVEKYLVDMDEIKEEIITIFNDIERLGDEISTNKDNISSLNIKIDTEIQDTYNVLKTYIDAQDSILDNKIENIQIGAISLYNPVTGTIDPLQTVINDLYNINNKDGLTASEFDALELTASEFDAYDITAYEFDSQGKIILQ